MSSFPLTEDRRTRQFVLTIRNIREEDYGNYTCVATNSLGAARREVTVSGRPLAPSLVPGARGNSRTEYIVRWRVNSAFPVLEHNIYYERISGNKVQLQGNFIERETLLLTFYSLLMMGVNT